MTKYKKPAVEFRTIYNEVPDPKLPPLTTPQMLNPKTKKEA